MDIVEDLRLNHEYCPKDVILQAADEIERLRKTDKMACERAAYWEDMYRKLTMEK
jgi:hypothetical protein